MSVAEAVIYVWDRLRAFGYHRPELITARESLRIVQCDVEDREAYTVAWDIRSNAVIKERSANATAT